MKDVTLVIMAAGIGSRFGGGIKQLAPVGPNGEIIMEGKPSSVLREEKILNRIGLELPFMIDLSLKLEFYELLDNEITDMDRMVDTLWK